MDERRNHFSRGPIVAAAPVERGPPTLETRPSRTWMRLAALDPDTRLLAGPDQPALKGYIMYANSQTVQDAGAVARRDRLRPRPTRRQHTRRIERTAMFFDVDVQMIKAFPRMNTATIRKPRPANTSACSSFPTGSFQILAGRHLRHTRLLDRGSQKVCD